MISDKKMIFSLKAKNIPPSSKKLPDEDFKGLQNIIHLQIGMKVRLTVNLWI
jgi:hypothetical protein